MPSDPTQAKVSRRSYLTVVVLAGVYSLNFLDRQLLSILAEPIRTELTLSDTQLGLLSGLTFALFYSLFGVPVAWLADRSNRVRMVAGACALWSLFTATCGFAGNFMQLALARVGVGVGEAGCSPPSYSIIADCFPPERRGGAMAIYSLGVPLGTTGGAALGGWIASTWGWRSAFLAMGVVGVTYALLALVILREPSRGRFEGAAGNPKALMTTLRHFAGDRLLRSVSLAAGFSAFVGYAMLSWTPAMLMRTKGMTLHELAIYYSILSGVSAAIGTLSSGHLVDRLGQVDRRMYGFVPAAAFLVSIPFYIAGIYVSSWALSLALLSVPFAFYGAYLPPALAMVQNRVAASERSTASSILLLMMSLIGLGGGPYFIGAISDLAKGMGSGSSLTVAMLMLAPVFALAGLLHLRVAQIIGRDAL